MSHLTGLLVENAANFPLNDVDQCQTVAVELAKLLSILLPTTQNAASEAGNADKGGGTRNASKLREELRGVEHDLRAHDLRVEALQRALRQEVEARKVTFRCQKQLISKINKFPRTLQLPLDVVAYIWKLYNSDCSSAESGYWRAQWVDRDVTLRKAFGRDLDPSRVFMIYADEVGEDKLCSSGSTKLHVAFRDVRAAASGACKPLELSLRYKERWSTLHITMFASEDDNGLTVFLKCAPAWPHLEHITLKKLDHHRSGTFAIIDDQASTSFAFSITPHQAPRRLKSAELEGGFLVPFKAFIAEITSLSLNTVAEDLINFHSNIIPHLPAALKELKLCFGPIYDEIYEEPSDRVRLSSLNALELVYFTPEICSGILAPFGGISLQRLILSPHSYYYKNGIIEEIDTLFPRLTILGLSATGMVIPDGTVVEHSEYIEKEDTMFEFICDAITLICGQPSREPVLKHLYRLEIPFPNPCTFEGIRRALEHRRYRRDIKQIDQLVMDCRLPSETSYLHGTYARFTDSLQFIVKDVLLLNQEKCFTCR